MDNIILKKIGKKNINNIIVFFTIGMLAHAGIWLYKIASTDCNTAGLFYYTLDWEVTLGRWLIRFVDGIRYYLSVPFFAGPIAVFLFAIGTVIIINILEIESDATRYVVGGFLMVTPTIGNTLMFYYCADSYALAMIFACLYVYIVKKKASSIHFFLAVCSLIISLGLYQAYLGVAAVLCAAVLILMIINDESSITDILKKAGFMLVSAGTGVVLYYCITQSLLRMKKLSLADYGGANNIAGTSILDIKIAIALSYQKFIQLFWGLSRSKYHSFYRGSYYAWCVAALFIYVFVIIIKRKRIYKEPIKMGILFVLMLIVPFLSGIIMLIVKGHSIHILMCQSYFIIIGVVAAVILRFDNNMTNERTVQITCSIFLGLVCLMGVELSAINNSTYEYNHFIRNNMSTTLNRVLAQAESLDGYTKEMEFAFAGQPLNGYPVESYLEKMAFLETDTLYDDEYRFNLAMIDNMFKEDIGCAIKMCDSATFEEMVNSDEFAEMPIYPDKGSVKIVSNCVLVKFSEDVPMPREDD